MFTRVKESRNGEYLQIVENYRDEGRVRQRMVLYVGRYDSIDVALHRMPGELRNWRASYENHENRWTRGVCPKRGRGSQLPDSGHGRLQALRALAKEHPELLERDRERAARRPGQVAARNRARRAQRERERRASAERSDQNQQREG